MHGLLLNGDSNEKNIINNFLFRFLFNSMEPERNENPNIKIKRKAEIVNSTIKEKFVDEDGDGFCDRRIQGFGIKGLGKGNGKKLGTINNNAK